MTITAVSALWFLPFALVIGVWVAWNDMKFMKIPNKAVLALTGVYVIIGVLALPLPEYLWRYVHLAVVLAVGFALSVAGLLGAGDAKFAAAMAPFVALSDAAVFMYLFAAILLTAFATHRVFRATPAIRARFADWESWERKDFPMGLALAGSLIFYLVAGALYGA